MPKAKVNDIEMNYEVHGDGYPLAMITGLMGSLPQWSRQISEFSERYRTVVFDNRGAGDTDKPDVEYSIEMFADDTIGLMDHLNIDRAHILGLSLGGMIAQEIALKYPDRVNCLVLCCTNCGWKESIPPSEEVMQALMVTEDVTTEEMVRKSIPFLFTEDFVKKNPVDIEEFIKTALKSPRPAYAFKRQMDAAMKFDSSDRLANISAPTLILTGGEDVLMPHENSRMLAEKIKSSELVVLPKGGHCFFWEIHDELNKAVLNFLSKRSERLRKG